MYVSVGKFFNLLIYCEQVQSLSVWSSHFYVAQRFRMDCLWCFCKYIYFTCIIYAHLLIMNLKAVYSQGKQHSMHPHFMNVLPKILMSQYTAGRLMHHRFFCYCVFRSLSVHHAHTSFCTWKLLYITDRMKQKRHFYCQNPTILRSNETIRCAQ